MFKRVIVALMFILVIFCACTDEHGSSPTSFTYDALPAPDNLELIPGVWEIFLSWDFPAEKEASVESYLVYRYYLTEYGEYVELADSTSEKEYTDSGLIGNVQYCYMVSAVDTNGMEGWRSEIECEVTLTPEE